MVDLTVPERRRRWLWGLAATLLIGLALAVAILSESQIEHLQFGLLPRESFGALLAAMVGLVILFVLYGTWQHGRILAKDSELRRLAAHDLILRERLGELSSLLEMSSQLAQKLDLRVVLSLAASRVLPCLEADCSSVYLFNPRTGLLEEVASSGNRAGVGDSAKLRPGEGLVGYVYSTRETQNVESEEMRARFAGELGLAGAPNSALCAPIRFEGTCLGVFCIARVDVGGPFVAMHARALQALADHCGAAIVKDFHFQRVARQAQRTA
jgi:hypothetical protein